MSDVLTPSPDLFRVVVHAEGPGPGRRSLWPAGRPLPAGWQPLGGARARAECLEAIRRDWTALAAPSPASSPAPAPAAAMDFGLMFFGGDEATAARDKYAFVLEVARLADAHGFKAVWLPERHFTAMGSLYPNPALLHAAVAVQTRSVRLRAGSVVLPLNDPLRVVEDWAVVDNLSGGRVEVSFAPGWNAEDFVLRPGTFEQRYDLLAEALPLVRHLWGGGSVTRPDGNGQPVTVRTFPTPVQPILPIWLTAASSPRTFQLAGSLGADLLTHLFDQSVEELAEKIGLYRAARRAAGFDPDAGRVAVTLHTFLGPDQDAVRRDAHGPYCDYLAANLPLLERLAQSRGLSIDLARLPAHELRDVLAWIFEKFLAQRSLFGTPESCAPLVERLRAIGVQEIACLLDVGPSPQAVLQSLPSLCRLKDACRAG